MKKKYIVPQLERIALYNERIMVGASDMDHADGKENTGTNPTIDDEEDHLNAKFNWSVWGDDEEEEDN